jgi:hypothetical protein
MPQIQVLARILPPTPQPAPPRLWRVGDHSALQNPAGRIVFVHRKTVPAHPALRNERATSKRPSSLSLTLADQN